MRSRLKAGLAAVILATATLSATPAAQAETGPFQLFLSPTGSASASGLTASDPVRTLDQAEERLKQAGITGRDVEVRIAQGSSSYVQGTTYWDTYIPDHTISFLPIDYNYSGSLPAGGQPVFQSPASGGVEYDYWFMAGRDLAGNYARSAGLRFYYLKVSGYRTGGLNINGGYADQPYSDGPLSRPDGPGLNNNTVYGMRFQGLGTKHNTSAGAEGQGALVLANSSGNNVRNNFFVNVENVTGTAPANAHGIYMRAGSNGNYIASNQFQFITGAAIDVRNDANNNVIENNTFTRVGNSSSGQKSGEGVYLDWSCDRACAYADPKNPVGLECSSHGNKLQYNRYGKNYANTETARLFRLREQTSTPHSQCTNEGQPWLATNGNTVI